MPPRKTTDFGSLFELLVEDLQVQMAASVDRALHDFSKRLARIEQRLDMIDPDHASVTSKSTPRTCALCVKPSVARGLCSTHYQQWRYRERKNQRRQSSEAPNQGTPPQPDSQTDFTLK